MFQKFLAIVYYLNVHSYSLCINDKTLCVWLLSKYKQNSQQNIKESKIYSCWLHELNLTKHIKLFSFMTAKID